MENQPIIIQQLVNAPVDRVWHALTDRDQMKDWYFNLKEFKPEPGFKFQFYGGTEDKQYLHLCKVTEVIPERKISYTWQYEGIDVLTLVTFELDPEEDQTLVKLTHSGVENFPKDDPNLARENFVAGWTDLVQKMLKDYVENVPA
jgi:uncharacterized protein YndB with AHSA1/START domain